MPFGDLLQLVRGYHRAKFYQIWHRGLGVGAPENLGGPPKNLHVPDFSGRIFSTISLVPYSRTSEPERWKIGSSGLAAPGAQTPFF